MSAIEKFTFSDTDVIFNYTTGLTDDFVATNMRKIAFSGDVAIGETNASESLGFYPNPASDFIYLTEPMTSNTEISANWSPSSDVNSDIESYWYSIGTSPGATDVLNWTDNWFDTLFTHTGLSLIYGTTYYVNIKVENGAGLFSNVVSSNGQLLNLPVNPPTASFTVFNTYVCVTDSIQFSNSSQDATDYSWSVPGAVPSASIDANPYFQFPSSGVYEVTLIADGPGGTDTEIQFITIEAQDIPVAGFSQSTATVDIDYAFVTFTNNSVNANGYYWDFGDGTNSSDMNPWHEYTDTGTFEVMLIAINGSCPNDTTWSTVNVIQTNGIELNDESVFTIYPVPVQNELVIVLKSEFSGNTLQIEILDSRGRLIQAEQIPANGQTIIQMDAAKYESGVYFIKLIHPEGAVIQKFVKE